MDTLQTNILDSNNWQEFHSGLAGFNRLSYDKNSNCYYGIKYDSYNNIAIYRITATEVTSLGSTTFVASESYYDILDIVDACYCSYSNSIVILIQYSVDSGSTYHTAYREFDINTCQFVANEFEIRECNAYPGFETTTPAAIFSTDKYLIVSLLETNYEDYTVSSNYYYDIIDRSTSSATVPVSIGSCTWCTESHEIDGNECTYMQNHIHTAADSKNYINIIAQFRTVYEYESAAVDTQKTTVLCTFNKNTHSFTKQYINPYGAGSMDSATNVSIHCINYDNDEYILVYNNEDMDGITCQVITHLENGSTIASDNIVIEDFSYIDIGMHYFFENGGKYYLLCNNYPSAVGGLSYLIESDTVEKLIEAASTGVLRENVNCIYLDIILRDAGDSVVDDSIIKDQSLILSYNNKNSRIYGFAGVPCLPTYDCEYNVFMKIKN